MVVFVFIALVVVIGISILFLLFSKNKKPLHLGAILGISHLFLVILLAYAIYRSSDGEACMGWLIFYGVDIPSSFMVDIISKLFNSIWGNNAIRNNYHIPFATFAIFGSLQYFFIGLGIGYLCRKISKRGSPAPK